MCLGFTVSQRPPVFVIIMRKSYMEELSISWSLKKLTRSKGNSAGNSHSDLLVIVDWKIWSAENCMNYFCCLSLNLDRIPSKHLTFLSPRKMCFFKFIFTSNMSIHFNLFTFYRYSLVFIPRFTFNITFITSCYHQMKVV